MARNGPYKVYTEKQKAGALLLLEAAGYPQVEGAIARVAKEQRIAERTLRNWANASGKRNQANAEDRAALKEEIRPELVSLIENHIYAALGALADKLDDASYKDTAWAAAVLIDKLQLLNDKPTQNVQQAITFERRGISTLPEHLASGTATSIAGDEAV